LALQVEPLTPALNQVFGRIVAGSALALVCALLPSHAAASGKSVVVSSTALTDVIALGVSTGATPVYVAMPSGLYRSLDPSLHTWQHVNSVPHINLVSPNREVPNDVVFATDQGIFRSTDGGRTSVDQLRCALDALIRAPSAPTILYAATLAYKDCPPAFQGATAQDTAPKQVLLKSHDDGLTWSTVYRPTTAYAEDVEFGPMAVDPHDANYVLSGYLVPSVRSYLTVETRDGGKHWPVGKVSPLTYAPASAIEFDPLHRDHVWVAWGTGCQNDLDLNQRAQRIASAPQGSIANLAFDPGGGGLYARYTLGCGNPFTGAGVFLLNRASNRFVPIATVPLGGPGSNSYLAITRTGYLLTAASGSRLVIVKLPAHTS
jgi:hypothetical protein